MKMESRMVSRIGIKLIFFNLALLLPKIVLAEANSLSCHKAHLPGYHLVRSSQELIQSIKPGVGRRLFEHLENTEIPYSMTRLFNMAEPEFTHFYNFVRKTDTDYFAMIDRV